jgi:hypothetical protein
VSVSRNCYQQALEQYPSIAAAQELKRVEKLASEELREAIQRISTRKLIWKRYQCQLMDAQNPETQKMTDQELLERAMQVWSERVKSMVKLRRQRDSERAQYDKMMEQWVQKKKEAREKVRMREEGLDGTRPNTAIAPTARRKELVKVLEDWPTPRPSPHYRLRVFGVLHEAAKRPATGAPLLPLLKERKIRKGGGKMVGGEDLHVTFGGGTVFSPRVSTIEIDSDIATRGKANQLSQDQWWRNSGSPFDSVETHSPDRSRQDEKVSFRDVGRGVDRASPSSSGLESDIGGSAIEASDRDETFVFDDEDVIDYAMPQRLDYASVLPVDRKIDKKEFALPKLGLSGLLPKLGRH